MEMMVSIAVLTTLISISLPFLTKSNEARLQQERRQLALETSRNVLAQIQATPLDQIPEGEWKDPPFLSSISKSLREPILKLNSEDLKDPIPHRRVHLELTWKEIYNTRARPVQLFVMVPMTDKQEAP